MKILFLFHLLCFITKKCKQKCKQYHWLHLFSNSSCPADSRNSLQLNLASKMTPPEALQDLFTFCLQFVYFYYKTPKNGLQVTWRDHLQSFTTLRPKLEFLPTFASVPYFPLFSPKISSNGKCQSKSTKSQPPKFWQILAELIITTAAYYKVHKMDWLGQKCSDFRKLFFKNHLLLEPDRLRVSDTSSLRSQARYARVKDANFNTY